MKYIVTKQGLHAKLYAVVSRDGFVVWNPQRVKATELNKDRAVEIANKHKAEALCAECGGKCDHILEALKASFQCA